MQKNIELITHIVEPSVYDELERLGAKLKAFAKSYEICRMVIITANEIIWRSNVDKKVKRNHFMNANKKPQLRKTK